MATKARGTKLKIGTTEPIEVGSLTSIGGIEISADSIDVSVLDSPDGFREFIKGFKDGGEVPLEGYFNPAAGKGQIELYDLIEGDELTDFSIVFPPRLDAEWKFKGFVIGFGTGVDLEDPLSFTCTIKVSGKPELIIGTPEA